MGITTLESEAYHYAISEVTKAYQDTPNGDVLLAKIAENFKKQYENPPKNIFETLIGRAFTSEEVRCTLFRPTEEQARFALLQVLVASHLKILKFSDTK